MGLPGKLRLFSFDAKRLERTDEMQKTVDAKRLGKMSSYWKKPV